MTSADEDETEPLGDLEAMYQASLDGRAWLASHFQEAGDPREWDDEGRRSRSERDALAALFAEWETDPIGFLAPPRLHAPIVLPPDAPIQ